jgi:hypothetical protein
VVAAAWVETSGQFETSTVTQTYEQLA